tara:strand:+ start:1842 stop:2135 length:294 start_codon:yes stop_codon:yes gene_type:complete
MKVTLSGLHFTGLPSPDVAKAAQVKLASPPVLRLLGTQVIRLEGRVCSASNPDIIYEVAICQDPPEWSCGCPHYIYRNKFCKHLSKLLLSVIRSIHV